MDINQPVVNQIRNLSANELSPIAAQVLGEEAVNPSLVAVEKIGVSAGQATLGIYRVQGLASTAAGERSWSAVVKAVGILDNFLPVGDFDGLKEPLVYQEGAFAKLCGRVRAAHCYAIQRHEGTQFLWLEDLSKATQPPWSQTQFVESAGHLGQFNAHWPEQSLPAWEWLNHIRMREFFRSRRFAEMLAKVPALQGDPLAGRALPPDIVRDLSQLWDESDLLLAKTEDAPRGICHGNCHSRNLFPMHDTTHGSYTVAIDWVKVGVNAIGEDLGHLLGSAIVWLDLSIDEAKSGVDSLFHAYVGGLKVAGWAGNEEQVRLTLLTRLACEALRAINIVDLVVENSEFRATVAGAMNKTIEAICDRYAEALGFYGECREQALRLAKRF